MKTHILVMLLAAAALVAGGFAQSTSSNEPPAATTGQTAPASQSADSSDREPLKAETPTDFWNGDDPNVVNLVTHAFANKKYVQRQVGPIRDRLNELEELTSENSKQIKDVDAHAQKGIQLASENTSVADEHASEAGKKAQLAETAATEASAHVNTAEQMVSGLDQYQGSAQTEIRFRPGQSVLSKAAKDALDQMAAPLKDKRSYVIEVRGFAPGHGQAAIANSQKMADSVVRYFVLAHNIPVYRIHVESLGNAVVTGESQHASAARVEVSVLRNDLVSSAQR